jgi:hypothetical protein
MLNPEKTGLVWIDDLTGGLNVTDPPQLIRDDQCQVAENIEWNDTRLAQRRQGGVNPIGTEIWAAQVTLSTLIRHTPTIDEGAAELWGIPLALSVSGVGRLAAGNNWAAVTAGDTINPTGISATLFDVSAVSFNGKLFLAYDSTQDRLHVWDGTSLRRVGLPKPGAPTVANTGAGAYPAIQRWYKVQWYDNNVALNQPLSPLSDAVAFTPSGAGTAARITRPTAAGEHETAWLVYGSPDNINFYLISGAIAIGTTTYDDAVAPNTYVNTSQPSLTAPASDLEYYTTPPSPKYLLADGARLLLISSWETPAFTSRVWFTPVLHTSVFATADDERVPSTNFLDLDPSDGGGITGAAMYNGAPYVFKLSRIYKLVATGNATKPYTRVIVSRTIGALHHRSIFVGDDDAGQQCLYFLSRRGPYRFGPNGLEYLGRDIEPLWKTFDLLANGKRHGVYHETKGQAWWWMVDGVFTNTLIKLSVKYARRQGSGEVRGGWSTDTGDVADGVAAVMFANTMGATMSTDLKPHVAQFWRTGDPDGPVIKYDADGTFTDRGSNGVTYVAKVRTKAFRPAGLAMRGAVQKGYVVGKPASGSPRALNLSVSRNFDAADAKPGVITLPVSTAGRVQVPCEELSHVDADFVDLTLHDSGLGTTAWTIDAIGARVRKEGPA